MTDLAPAVAPVERVDGPTGRSHARTVAFAAAALLVATAIYLRASWYWPPRSFWIDEAYLALNTVPRSFGELLRPLDYSQAAPVLFLWAEHLMASLFGPTEGVLRLVPFASSVALPPVLFLGTPRTYGEAAALVAAALAATSGYLAYYSVQAKQYSSDVLVATLVLALVLRVLARPGAPRRWAAFAAGGVAAVLASQPAVFVLAGCGLAPLLLPEVRRAPRLLRWWLAANAAWAIAFALAYLLLYRASDSDYMRAFWEGRYLRPTEPGRLGRAYELAAMLLVRLVIGTGHDRRAAVVLAAVAFAWGAVALVRRDRAQAAAVLLPIAAMTGANVVGLYPYEGRLWISLTPFICLVYANGAWAVASLLAPVRRWRAVATILVLHAMVAVPIMAYGSTLLRHGLPNRTVIAAMESRREGVPLYTHPRATPLYVFYTTDWSNPDTVRLRRHALLGTYPGPLFENAPSRGRRVAHEGDEFRFADANGELVAGLAQGAMVRITNLTGGPNDPGWLENEVRRIREAARPRVWVFFSGTPPSQRREFLAAVLRDGGRVVESMGGSTWVGASLLEIDAPARPVR